MKLDLLLARLRRSFAAVAQQLARSAAMLASLLAPQDRARPARIVLAGQVRDFRRRGADRARPR